MTDDKKKPPDLSIHVGDNITLGEVIKVVVKISSAFDKPLPDELSWLDYHLKLRRNPGDIDTLDKMARHKYFSQNQLFPSPAWKVIEEKYYIMYHSQGEAGAPFGEQILPHNEFWIEIVKHNIPHAQIEVYKEKPYPKFDDIGRRLKTEIRKAIENFFLDASEYDHRRDTKKEVYLEEIEETDLDLECTLIMQQDPSVVYIRVFSDDYIQWYDAMKILTPKGREAWLSKHAEPFYVIFFGSRPRDPLKEQTKKELEGWDIAALYGEAFYHFQLTDYALSVRDNVTESAIRQRRTRAQKALEKDLRRTPELFNNLMYRIGEIEHVDRPSEPRLSRAKRQPERDIADDLGIGKAAKDDYLSN